MLYSGKIWIYLILRGDWEFPRICRYDRFSGSPYILSVFDEDIASLIQSYILENSNNQLKFLHEDSVKEFLGHDTVNGVLTTKGSGFETEMVVISAGVKPVVDIADSLMVTKYVILLDI